MINSVHIYSQITTNIFNDRVKSGKFPDILKYADITPVFKTGDVTDKTYYRPISTLSNFSKVFEKMIYVHINSFMEPKLSKYIAGFRARHNTQHALLKMLETWYAMLNKGNKVGAIIMDLSKKFDTLNHNLLFCKLKTYEFNKNALTLILSYFTNRHQRTTVGDKFSKWQKISTGVPQSSILGPLFFNIFINVLFLSLKLLHNAAMQTTILCILRTKTVIL